MFLCCLISSKTCFLQPLPACRSPQLDRCPVFTVPPVPAVPPPAAPPRLPPRALPRRRGAAGGQSRTQCCCCQWRCLASGGQAHARPPAGLWSYEQHCVKCKEDLGPAGDDPYLLHTHTLLSYNRPGDDPYFIFASHTHTLLSHA